MVKEISCLSSDSDNLFSNDYELQQLEPDILNYLPSGRNSYLNTHRLSQDRILDILDAKGIHDSSGDRLTKAAVIDIKEVNDWSKFMTLRFIFQSLSNDVGDIFHEKSLRYKAMEQEANNRAQIKLDFDGSGAIVSSESVNLVTGELKRQ